MNKNEKKQLILDFINGPLQEYLNQDISFGKFKERINEVCGTDFSYSDLYPSYLFNATLSYEEDQLDWDEDTIVTKCDPYEAPQECLEIIPGTFAVCGELYGDQRQYCSKQCLEKAKGDV